MMNYDSCLSVMSVPLSLLYCTVCVDCSFPIPRLSICKYYSSLVCAELAMGIIACNSLKVAPYRKSYGVCI